MSETQVMIQDSVQRLFAALFTSAELARFERDGPSGAVWQACAELGLDRALLKESQGGIGAAPADVFSVAHACGYYAATTPLADSMVAAGLLQRAGIHVPEGCIALIDDTGSAQPLAVAVEGGERMVSGTVHKVPWADQAHWGVAAIAQGSTAEVLLLPLAPRRGDGGAFDTSSAGEPRASLSFEKVKPSGAGHVACNAGINPVRLAGALARSAQISGALERALELAVQYARDRVQFGKPIGNNQAIQHMLATLAGQAAGARVAALLAWSGSADSAFDIAVAKARCSDVAGSAAAIVHQVHGAIGFTREHPLNFYTRRLWSWRSEFGSNAWWSEELGRQAIRAGSAKFWRSLVERQFPAN
ncbi:MAG: acyl-CoA dehydrogenase family protein [Pseudomonadota bacterium]